MYADIYTKIGPAGVVIAVLSFVSFYLFLASSIYLAWIARGFRQFKLAIQKREPAVTKENCRMKSNISFSGILEELMFP